MASARESIVVVIVVVSVMPSMVSVVTFVMITVGAPHVYGGRVVGPVIFGRGDVYGLAVVARRRGYVYGWARDDYRWHSDSDADGPIGCSSGGGGGGEADSNSGE